MTPAEALRPSIAALRSPSQRRQFAAALRAIADQQERIAEAEQRQQARPAEQRLTRRSPHAGPGRAPSAFVRLAYERKGRQEHLRLYIGRALWYALGSPARLDIQRLGGPFVGPFDKLRTALRTARVVLSPCDGDRGYAVIVGSGMPRFFCADAADLLPEPGRYAASVDGGVLTVGGRLP